MEEKVQKQPKGKGNTESTTSSKTISASGPTPKTDKSPLEGKESGVSQPSVKRVKRGASSPPKAKTEKKKKEVETLEA